MPMTVVDTFLRYVGDRMRMMKERKRKRIETEVLKVINSDERLSSHSD